jgi:hypothetical protein
MPEAVINAGNKSGVTEKNAAGMAIRPKQNGAVATAPTRPIAEKIIPVVG